MAAYVLAEITVEDPLLYKQYASKTPDSIAKYGGEFIIRGNPIEILEGDLPFERLVLLRFESIENARTWYNSEDYQRLREIRAQASNGRLLLIEV